MLIDERQHGAMYLQYQELISFLVFNFMAQVNAKRKSGSVDPCRHEKLLVRYRMEGNPVAFGINDDCHKTVFR